MKEQDVKIKKTYYQTSIFFQIIISIFLAAFIVFQAMAIEIVVLIITCIMNNDYCAIIGLNQKDLENQGILA